MRNIENEYSKDYTIIRIDEEDYGCEGRPDGQPAMDLLILEDAAGNQRTIRQEDAWLYSQNLREGDLAFLDLSGRLQKHPVRKLAVVFPGIGYHTDKPLLYYSKKLASAAGYEIVEVPYSNFPKNVKGSPEKMQEAFLLALDQAEAMLSQISFGSYGRLLFLSKSLGTVVAAAYARNHSLNAHHIFYTPVETTFSFEQNRGIVFHGTKDTWVETRMVEDACQRLELPLYLTKDANHSLETGDPLEDLKNLQLIMEHTKAYIQQLDTV